ncbi:MAG TPA: glycoside hydrolase family 47 protein [Thermoplasmata archaeon]|nr:glycoside hydrolase family 47 protein [Thermoplasmata archaeon]
MLDFKSEFENAVNWVINNISFDKDIDVQVFETNIRLLGGLISAYQISGEEELLILSIDLANRLLPAFDSPTGMPYRFVNLKTGKVSGNTSNPAEIGTLSLEFGTLSKLTKNPVYCDKVKNAVKALYERRSELDLVGSGINVDTGEWTDETSHIGGCMDSFYEYLWKSWVLFGDKEFLDMYATCIGAVEKHLAEVYDERLWYKRVNMNTGKLINRHFGALDLFLPGLFVSSNQVSRGEKLIQSGYYMWNEWGIEPELIDYSTMNVLNPGYALRPELMESTYHLWKLTGNPQYRERGYTLFESIVKGCKSDVGYARIKDVTTMEKEDLMDSFFFAETLKYAYLLFDDSGLNYNLTVFNTEAHPFLIVRD